MSTLPQSPGLLILPHLRIQNANAISSPLTHGFPSMTAFLGLMWAIERKLDGRHPITLDAVGVICHDYDEQTTEGGYTKAFRLTRNPVDKDGSTAAIVEEGRIHLDITLVFGVGRLGEPSFVDLDDAERQTIADSIADVVAGMRVAGGSVLPSQRPGWQTRPRLVRMAEDPSDAAKQFRQLRRRWLPGFTLVCRDDLLQQKISDLHTSNPSATGLDAWLDLSRFNWKPAATEQADDVKAKVEWKHDRSEGWIVPIPVGYGALSDPHPAGTVQNARDQSTGFRFVESLYSIGQWISPHRLDDARELLWHAHTNASNGLYRCNNDFARAISAIHD
jgi:CRISPR-associated protein Csy2